MIQNAQKRSVHRNHGSAAVEAAVVMPFLMILALGATDLATFSYAGIHIASAAANGAQYGSTSLTAANDSQGIKNATQLDQMDIPQAMLNKMSKDYNYSASNPTVTSQLIDIGGGNKDVKVTVTYLFPTMIKYPGIPSTVTIKHSVRMRVMQ